MHRNRELLAADMRLLASVVASYTSPTAASAAPAPLASAREYDPFGGSGYPADQLATRPSSSRGAIQVCDG